MIYNKKGDYILPVKGFLYFSYFLKQLLTILFSRGDYHRVKVMDHHMYVNLNDTGLSQQLIWRPIREELATKHFISLMKKKDVFLEAGANIGYYALIEQEYCPGGYTICFEPHPENFELLVKNVQPYENVEFYNYALGSKKGKTVMHVGSDYNGGSIYRNFSHEKTIEIDVLKPDTFLRDRHIDVIRMDVEGYEAEIIKGMHKILSRKDKPRILYIEMHPTYLEKNGHSLIHLYHKIRSYGYKLNKVIYDTNDPLKTKKYRKTYDDFDSWVTDSDFNTRSSSVFFERE